MWMDYYLCAESKEAFLAILPVGWKDEDGNPAGSEIVALDVVGDVNGKFLVNLRYNGLLPEEVCGIVIAAPQFPRRVFA